MSRSHDAELVASYPNDDGTFIHAKLDIYGQILAVSKALKYEKRITRTIMHNVARYFLKSIK